MPTGVAAYAVVGECCIEIVEEGGGVDYLIFHRLYVGCCLVVER